MAVCSMYSPSMGNAIFQKCTAIKTYSSSESPSVDIMISDATCVEAAFFRVTAAKKQASLVAVFQGTIDVTDSSGDEQLVSRRSAPSVSSK